MCLHANQMGKYLHCKDPAKKHRAGGLQIPVCLVWDFGEDLRIPVCHVSGGGLWCGILEGVVQAF